MREYRNFKLTKNGKLSYIYKRTVIDLGNINNRLKAPWEIRKLSVSKLKLMGFTSIKMKAHILTGIGTKKRERTL